MIELLTFGLFIGSVLYWIKETHRHEETMAELDAKNRPAPAQNSGKQPIETEPPYVEERWLEAYEASGSSDSFDGFKRFHKRKGRTADDVLRALKS